MTIKLSEAEMLVTQTQIAHRLAVGFYQRLLPLLERIAGELDLQFWYWEPAHTSRPSQSTTSPNSKWKWDFVPLFASRHVFWRIAGEKAQPGDVVLVFNVYIDENFKPEKRKALGIKGQPDPLLLPTGPALVEIFLYRSTGESDMAFSKEWQDLPWPDDAQEEWESVASTIEARKLAFPLPQFITDTDSIIASIRKVLEDVSSGSV